MKLDIGALSYDPVWYDFETGEPTSDKEEGKTYIQVKPAPFSEQQIILRDGDMVLDGKTLCATFKKACTAWKGINGANGEPLPCTDAVKQKVYDFQLGGISNFVIRKCWEFMETKETDEKNS